MKTLQSTLKFMRTWCRSRAIELVSSEKVVVPHAVYDRKAGRRIIYMPLISAVNFFEWQRQGYHESAHLAPENLWHYDVMAILGKKKGIMLHDISNCLVDNLAERVDFQEYRGRAEILSSGRAAFAERLGEIMRKATNDPKHLMRSALLKWDTLNREKWMINFVFPPAHEEMQHLEELYQKTNDIKLDYIIDQIADSDDIRSNTNEMVELCLEIDSWLPSQNGKGGDGETDDKQATEAGDGTEDGSSEGTKGSAASGSDDKEGPEKAEKSSGTGAGDNKDSGAGDSVGSGEDSKPGDPNSTQQQGTSSESGDFSEQTPTPTGRVPTTATSAGSNFNPNDQGAGITKVVYTQAEVEALSQYNQDIERGIGNDMKENVREVHYELMQRGQRGAYTPCIKQEEIKIPSDCSFKRDKKDNIMDEVNKSTLDKTMRRHLQLRSTGRTVHGVKRGRLSSKNLHRLYHGGSQIQPAVFKRSENGKVKMDSAVSLLIDFSGSMGSGTNAIKYILAAASTVAFAEVLNGLRIKHEIIGFTHSPGRNIMYLLKEFNEKPLSKDNLAEKLSSHKIHQDHNADGEALQHTAERLMQMKERNKVLMVLSDGQPNGYWVGDGKQYLRTVVDDIENHSPIHLCSIGIKTSSVRKYYTNYQVIHKIEELAGAVLETLKRNLLTM